MASTDGCRGEETFKEDEGRKSEPTKCGQKFHNSCRRHICMARLWLLVKRKSRSCVWADQRVAKVYPFVTLDFKLCARLADLTSHHYRYIHSLNSSNLTEKIVNLVKTLAHPWASYCAQINSENEEDVSLLFSQLLCAPFFQLFSCQAGRRFGVCENHTTSLTSVVTQSAIHISAIFGVCFMHLVG